MGVIDFIAKKGPGAAERLFNRTLNVAGGLAKAAPAVAAAGAGLTAGAAAGIGAGALILGYGGYRLLRGPSPTLHTTVGGQSFQLNPLTQTGLITTAPVVGAVMGARDATRKPWVMDMSPNGNLENTTPAQFGATGDIVLSQAKRYNK